jgi:hypothetical protein
MGIRILAALLLASALLTAGDESKTVAPPTEGPGVKRAINRAFRGRVVSIKKKRVRLFYDFEDPAQLEDFENARPPRLLDASQNQVSIQGGRLLLEGSSGIRHRMEGAAEMRAHFYLRAGTQANVGTFFSPPILNDFFIVLNLFDERFYRNGALIMAACGLHEDEGADLDMSIVNWRDIFVSNVQKKAKVGEEVEVEVAKDGVKEYCRVADVEGKGSSKGKGGEFTPYLLGFWVHQSRMSIDNLTLDIELTDKYLELNDLKAEISTDWEEVAETGPLAGVRGVPPNVRSWIEEYAGGKGDVRRVVEVLCRTGLPEGARQAASEVLTARKDPKAVPHVVDGLYHEDRLTRALAIAVVKSIVGKDFGYSPTAGEKARSESIRKLNAFMAGNRDRFYG